MSESSKFSVSEINAHKTIFCKYVTSSNVNLNRVVNIISEVLDTPLELVDGETPLAKTNAVYVAYNGIFTDAEDGYKCMQEGPMKTLFIEKWKKFCEHYNHVSLV